MLPSRVYLVGAGPGDEKLITIKGYELIKKADCIIYDYLVNHDLLRFRKNGCKLIYVGKKAGAHSLSQDDINQILVREAKLCHNVVRLKGGDPFIFGRGAEEASYLRGKKIDFEVVPGVTSAIAVPTYAGIPLTERNRTSTVGFISGREDPAKSGSKIHWQALVKALGTMVFLMGVGNLHLIVKRLIACGKAKDTPVALIRWGTTARQKVVVGTLKNIVELSRKNKISPPVIIVVGDTVGLRKGLDWFDRKLLFAKRIIVTRPSEQAGPLSERLRDLGAEVMEIPVIKVVSQRADTKLKEAFLANEYDWIFFSSQNGVNEFAAFLGRIGKDSRIFGHAKICALGPETAKSLRDIHINPDYIPSQFVNEAILRHFKNMHFRGKALSRVLILRAKKGRDILPNELKKAGVKVKIIDLYDTVVPRKSALRLREALNQRIDFVTFTSSSTVENFVKLLGRDYQRKLSGVKFASIGPITSRTLKKFCLKPDIEAKVYTAEGLVKAIVEKRKCD